MTTAGEISEIDVERLNKLFDGTFEQVFKRNETGGHEKKMMNQDLNFRNKVTNMPLSDLIFIKKLGEG